MFIQMQTKITFLLKQLTERHFANYGIIRTKILKS